MNDNVLIFGAGTSFSAGIPLLSNFMQRIFEIATKGYHEGVRVDEEDLELIQRIQTYLTVTDTYHGRVKFSDRNIEDVLSFLSINSLNGGDEEMRRLNDFVSAISKVIEICCSVKHNGNTSLLQNEGPELYRAFWRILIAWYENTGSIPAIITLNYDLVLERALLQQLVTTTFNRHNPKLPFDQVIIDYSFDGFPKLVYQPEYCRYRTAGLEEQEGVCLKQSQERDGDNRICKIELLKLHGSLNFPRNEAAKGHYDTFTSALKYPYIVPPIANKLTRSNPTRTWGRALELLRNAKNIAIVGYSMPVTDIDMQYFIKCAIGPNINLNRITVFDPVLYEDNGTSRSLRARYESCFASQLLDNRVTFKPDYGTRVDRGKPGTFEHFVSKLEQKNNSILF